MAKKSDVENVENRTLSDKEKQKLISKAWDILDAGNSEASMLCDALSNINSYEDTGCYVLNALMSGKFKTGGFPEGRTTILGAPSSVGKSYIGLRAAAIAQKKGKTILIFDSENAIDNSFASNLGLDVTKVKYFPVRSIEQCKNNMFAFLDFVQKNGLKGQFFILVDSLAGMMSELDFKRLEKESDSADMGTRAKAMRAFIQMMNTMSAATKTTIVCTNHVYENPGAMYPPLEKSMPGGLAVKYFASTVMQLSARQIKEDDTKVKTGDKAAIGSKGMTGIIIRGISVKNRVVRPYMEAEMYLSWEKGLRKYYGLLDLALKFGVLYNKMGKIYIPSKTEGVEDEFVGNRTKAETDKVLWERMMPILEEKIQEEWCYNVNNVDDGDEEDDDNLFEEELDSIEDI